VQLHLHQAAALLEYAVESAKPGHQEYPRVESQVIFAEPAILIPILPLL
jgi:hypothetical protein